MFTRRLSCEGSEPRGGEQGAEGVHRGQAAKETMQCPADTAAEAPCHKAGIPGKLGPGFVSTQGVHCAVIHLASKKVASFQHTGK